MGKLTPRGENQPVVAEPVIEAMQEEKDPLVGEIPSPDMPYQALDYKDLKENREIQALEQDMPYQALDYEDLKEKREIQALQQEMLYQALDYEDLKENREIQALQQEMQALDYEDLKENRKIQALQQEMPYQALEQANPEQANAGEITPIGVDLPVEVMENILSYLPVRSIARFRCVCSGWMNLFAVPRFIAEHFTHSPTLSLIHAREAFRYDYVHTFYLHTPALAGEPSTFQELGPFSEADISAPHMSVVGNCLGVFCIVQNLYPGTFKLWNPSTHALLRIPGPISPEEDQIATVSVGFGFDWLAENFFLIRILSRVGSFEEFETMVQLYRLERPVWEWLPGDFPFNTVRDEADAVINGVPYWLVKNKNIENLTQLAFFNSTTSTFTLEAWPWAENWKAQFGEFSEGVLGVLGVMLWLDGDEFREVWFRNAPGEWNNKYHISLMDDLPQSLSVVGFMWVYRIVLEMELMTLCVVDPEDLDNEEFLEGLWDDVFKVMSFKGSLTPLTGNNLG